MTDFDWKAKEDVLRSQAADALTYKRPDNAQPPAFKRLKIQPTEDDDLKRSLEEIEARAKAARSSLL